AAAIVLVLANVYPLLEMDARGLRSSTTIFGTVSGLEEAGMPSVAVLVLLTALALPVVELAAMLYMLLPLRMGHVPPGLRIAFRIVNVVQFWGMAEVFLLGTLISFVKLDDVAPVHPGVGLYSLVVFVFLLTAADAWYEPRAVWHCAHELGA
ncbi:MAG TPA: paraquat-inducible protein A, partial [Usitatibacter sp.]|nr:paraquat-inducible protein A [Usitatibacter sp.]